MDGEQLTYCLGIYKEKYYDNHIKSEPKVSYLILVQHHAKTFIFIQGCATDKEDVQIQLLNDYVGIQLKGEASAYEETRSLKSVRLCPAAQGGANDNPKSMEIV